MCENLEDRSGLHRLHAGAIILGPPGYAAWQLLLKGKHYPQAGREAQPDSESKNLLDIWKN